MMIEKTYKFPKTVRRWLPLPTSRILYYQIRNKNLDIIGQKAPFMKKEIIKSIPIRNRKIGKVRTAFGDILWGNIRVEWKDRKVKKVI